MGRACRSRATGDHSAALLFRIYTEFSLENTILPVLSPLKVKIKKKKTDLAPSLNFAKSWKEHIEDKSL